MIGHTERHLDKTRNARKRDSERERERERARERGSKIVSTYHVAQKRLRTVTP